MIRDDNYTTIQGWMRTKLNLKNNELIVYAIIYGMSQKEDQYFKGGLKYLTDWTGSTKQNIINILKTLRTKHLIERKEIIINNIKEYEYKAIPLSEI